MKRSLILLCAMGLATCLPIAAVADPLPGEVLKFMQRPMFDTVIPGDPVHYHGHDEFSTAYSTFDLDGNLIGYTGNYMADDFADRSTSPVVHVKWWGSYMNDQPLTERVHRFLISFEEDVPVGDPNNTFDFSHPGKPLLNQIVSRVPAGGVLTPGSGTFTETLFSPVSIDGPIFEYNAELHLGKEFRQEPDRVYWLKIVALVDVPPVDPPPPIPPRLAWGWHNRDYTIHDPLASVPPPPPPGVIPGEFPDGAIGVPAIPIWHFQDDAVQGSLNVFLDPTMPNMPIVAQSNVYDDKNYEPLLDGPSIIGIHSKDLAFELYTVPEPAGLLLIALGSATIVYLHRHRRG